MNIDELADAAVTAMVERLAGGVVDGVTTLITDRMSTSRTGTRALEQMGSGDTELAASVLSDELSRDPSFANALAEALGRPTIQQSSVTIGERARVRGDVAGGNIDKRKQFHIGSIRFGGGGLTALIVLGLLGGGGAGYGIYQTVVEKPGEGYVSQAQSRTSVVSSSASLELDESSVGVAGDGIIDISFDKASVLAVNGARIGRLPGGTVPSPAVCDQALGEQARIDGIKRGDVICVSTTGGGIAAVTISQMNPLGGGNEGFVLTLNSAYWATAS